MFSLFSIIVIVVLFAEIEIFNAFHLRIPYKFPIVLHVCKYFTRMFTSQGIKSVNISKNKILTNNSELTVTDAFIEGLFYKIFSSSIQGSNSMVRS